MKRPLTLFERGMYLDGRTPVTIVFPARIRGQLREDRLRHALARVQAKHPLLRCLIVQDDGAQDDGVREQGRPWFQLQKNAPPIPLRIVERKTDHDCERETRREWTQLFEASRNPLIRMTWLRGPETSELLLVCHHCICDGSSIVALLREILLLCEHPGRDIGTHGSLEPLEEILPDEVRHDPRLRRRTRWKAGLFKLFIRTRRPGPALGYGPVYATRWTLDRSATQALAQRCKAEGVTMFSALCVAFVLGFRAVRGARGVGKFAVPVDVRRFLPALRADSLFAMAPTVALSLRTPRPEAGRAISDADFWVLARALKADMDRKIARLGPSVHENLLGMERLHALFDKLIAYGQSRPSGGNVTLSWLGRLELPQDYGDFRLEAIHSPTAMLAPTPASLVTISGFDGSLDFALTSDEQSLPVAQALAVKDKAMQALRASSRAEPSPQPPLRAPARASGAGAPSRARQWRASRALSPQRERGFNTFGLIFVLYHPSAEFVRNLHKARAICSNVVAVDNSPEPDLRLHESLRQGGTTVICNRNRGGLAGAYNRGAEALLALGCEVIFLLDQDSDIDESFFTKMMRACSELGTDTFLLGPKIHEINLKRCMPVIPPGRRFPKPRRIDDETEGLFPTLFIISSGTALSAEAYRKLGAFREDYFIEYIDIEYGLRASSQGVPVYMNAAVTMRQTTGHIVRHGKLFTTHHAAWRRYYGARNAVHALRLYRSKWSLHWLPGLLALHQALCVALFEEHKFRKLVAIGCGYIDGLFGRLGPFEDRHPRVFSFCTGPARKGAAVEDDTSATARSSTAGQKP